MEAQTVFTTSDDPVLVANHICTLLRLLKPWQQIVVSVRNEDSREAMVSQTVINPQPELRVLVDEYLIATTSDKRTELARKISGSIRLQRKTFGLSLDSVAVALRVSISTLYRAENEKLPKRAILLAYIDFIERCLPVGK